MKNNFRVIHDAVEFHDPETQLNNTSFGIIKDYCYVRNILEKVVIEQVIDISEYEKEQKSEFRKRIFIHPNIPSIFELVIFNQDKEKSRQCDKS